jgi:hypothetical protein
MKTIGVPGGLGPQATLDFEARVHAAAQRLIPQLAKPLIGAPTLQILASSSTVSPLLQVNAVDGLDCFAYNEEDNPAGWELTWP